MGIFQLKNHVQIAGRYFAAGKSNSTLATLEKSSLGVMIKSDDAVLVRNLEIDEITDRLANVPRKVIFSDGGAFECSDNESLDVLLDQSNSFFSRLSLVEGSFKLVIVATLVCLAVIWGVYRYGLPAAAYVAAKVTPTNVVAFLDNNALETVDRILLKDSNLSDERKDELTRLFDDLVMISGQTEPPLKLLFRDGGRLGANALALPGGTIILTDQLEALSESDDELAGVFAHEIGHVEHQHSLRQLYRTLGVAFMIAVIAGETEQIVEEVLSLAVIIDNFGYSRSFEFEADGHSAEIMERAKRDPFAFVNLLDRVFEKYGLDKDKESGWLSTHPGNGERRDHVQRIIEGIR